MIASLDQAPANCIGDCGESGPALISFVMNGFVDLALIYLFPLAVIALLMLFVIRRFSIRRDSSVGADRQ